MIDPGDGAQRNTKTRGDQQCSRGQFQGGRQTLPDVHADREVGVPTLTKIEAQNEFKTGSWSGLLPSVIAGQADLMWSNLYYTPMRAEQVAFVTYLLAATRGIVRKGNPKNIHSLVQQHAAGGDALVPEPAEHRILDRAEPGGSAHATGVVAMLA